MACLRPRTAYDTGRLRDNGKRIITFSPSWPNQPSFPVPCGKCAACLSAKRKRWVDRMRIEALSCDRSSFLTLTFSESPGSLDKSHLQLFFKRLRNASRDFGIPSNFRYFACGEYGHTFHRPHYHAIIFGLDFLSPCWEPRQVAFSGRFPVYASGIIERIWPFGYNTVDRATFANMRYVSKYILKQSDGSDSPPFLVPPFVLHSLGLGRSFFVDVSRRGRHVLSRPREPFSSLFFNGSLSVPSDGGRYESIPVPSCLDRYAERFFPELFESVRAKRRDIAIHSFDDRLPSERERVIIDRVRSENKTRILDYET